MRVGHVGHLSGQTPIFEIGKFAFGPRGVQSDRNASIMSRLGRGVSQLSKTGRLAREVLQLHRNHHYRCRLAKIDFATRIFAAVSGGSKPMLAKGCPSDWSPLGFRLVSDWFLLGFRLVSAWCPLGFRLVPRLVSAWFPLGFLSGPAWFPIGFRLVSAWFPLGIRLVPAWFPIGFRLVSEEPPRNRRGTAAELPRNRRGTAEEPDTRHPKPDTRSPKPETQSLKP